MRRNVDPDYKFNKDRFAEVLKVAIGDRSYSAFGKEADISFGYISKYMNKKSDVAPTVQTLKKMARVAEVTYAEILEAAGYDSSKYVDDVVAISNIEDAVNYTLRNAKEDDVIISAGSLYMIGTVRTILNEILILN